MISNDFLTIIDSFMVVVNSQTINSKIKENV